MHPNDPIREQKAREFLQAAFDYFEWERAAMKGSRAQAAATLIPTIARLLILLGQQWALGSSPAHIIDYIMKTWREL